MSHFSGLVVLTGRHLPYYYELARGATVVTLASASASASASGSDVLVQAFKRPISSITHGSMALYFDICTVIR